MNSVQVTRGGILAIAGVAGLAIAFRNQANTLLAWVMGNAGVLALVAALWQILRDEAAHQKVVLLQHDDQLFQVGATSHMANTVFDKHVAFCEEYVAEVQAIVDTLMGGPSPAAMVHAGRLQSIRRKHATWVTHSMSDRLMRFENEVRQIGATARLLEGINHERHADKAAQVQEKLDGRMRALMPEFFDQEFKADGNSPTQVVERVRGMLGVNELVDLRSKLIARAHQTLSAAT